MKKILLLFFVIYLLNHNLFSQIHSTTVGGSWHEISTWVGGVVPDSSDDVVIEGPVIQAWVTGYTIHSVYCNNLTISSSGSLRNGGYGGGAGTFPVYIGGSVVNNGIVSNGSEDYLKIFIAGDIENNNIWMPYETEFHTSNNHNLSLATGKSFGSRLRNNGSPTFTALTDMLFTCDYSVDGNLYRDHFYLNGQTFNVGNHSIELRQCMINKGTLTGDIEILGTFTTGWTEGYDIRDTLLFVGNVTVTDTLTGNIYNGGYGIYRMRVNGNLTNNGVIKDDYDIDGVLNADDLELLITGNIINNGKWECNFTALIGNTTQTIYQSAGKMFDGFLTYLGSSSELVAQSDITVTKDLGLNNVILQMNNNKLNVNRWLTNGTINNCVLNNGRLQNIISQNNLTLTGTVTVDINNIFHGSVTVQDTLQSNEYGGGSSVFTLLIDGDITNNGLIKNINSGDMLSLEVNGNITNNGLWQNGYTKLKGAQDQHITLLNGHVFEGEFSDLDSTSLIIADTDLTFAGNFKLGKAILDMQNNELTINNYKWLYNGYLKDAKIHNGLLSDLRLLDQIEINGTVEIGDKVDAVANIVVNDTLTATMNNSGTVAYYFRVYGGIENKGFVGQIYDDLLGLEVNGSVTNRGNWSAYQNYLLFYQNSNTNAVSCFNSGTTNMLFNGSIISGIGAPAYSIISGGGIQTITPNQSYNLSVQFTPTSGDSTALLNIDCTEIGTLNNIYLTGHNYNTTVDVEEEKSTNPPNEFVLNQNYPNPFNPSTRIKYQVSSISQVTLKVYDVLGNEIVTLVNEEKPAGSFEVEFKSTVGSHQFASGIYFYQLQAGSFTQTKKMILLK